jgi:predicted nuclease of restriction endonuclease-like RecB superfamily
MLLSEHVLARRRDGKLLLRAMDARAVARAEAIAAELVAIARSHLGAPRGELEAALATASAEARDAKVKAGMTKLLLDRCIFDADPPAPPVELRAELFARAAAERRERGRIDRPGLVGEVARARGLSPEALERALYADLKASHTLAAVDASPRALAAAFATGQAQAVLLRAERVVARVVCRSPGTLRALFRALKFHRLLFHIATPLGGVDTALRDGEAHVIAIDGPLSLFESGTKYGPRLAMALPALEACDALELEAVVRWGKERARLVFHHEHRVAAPADAAEPALPDEVEALRDALARGDHGLVPRRSEALLALPGVGTCVPDLELEDERGRVAYVEVLGFWNRDAVWRRIELVEKGLGASTPIVFCVSSRLRVSEDALPADLPAALYVYKGAMSARAVAERARALLNRETAARDGAAATSAPGRGGPAAARARRKAR